MQGLVYATATPYNQLTIPAEERTGSDGGPSVALPDAPSLRSVRRVAAVELGERLGEHRAVTGEIFDRCRESNGPTLTVYHRESGRQKWMTSAYGPDDVYTTNLLPGFKLPVCPPK